MLSGLLNLYSDSDVSHCSKVTDLSMRNSVKLEIFKPQITFSKHQKLNNHTWSIYDIVVPRTKIMC